MQINDFLFVVSLLGVLQALLIVVMLLFRSGKKAETQWLLSGLLLSCATVMTLITLVNGGMIEERGWMKVIEVFITLLVGPMLFLYTRMEVAEKINVGKNLHFLPAFFWLCYGFSALWGQWPLFKIPFWFFILHFQTYTFLAGWHYYKAKMGSKKVRQANWIMLLLSFFLLLSIGQWLRFAFSQLDSLRLIVPSLAAFSFYGITLVGFQRSALLPSAPKYSKGVKVLKMQGWEDQRQSLEELMKKKERYTDPSLNRNKLAIELDLHPNQLTNLIHQYYGLGFTDYINQLRLEKVRLLLLDPEKQHLTLEAIGQEAGFQSRSAFYRLFKAEMGQTPAVYKKENLG